MHRLLVVSAFTTLVFLSSTVSCAQDHFPARSQGSLWYSGSAGGGSVLGNIEKGRLQLLGLRYHHLLLPAPTQDRASYDAPTLTYTADLIPAARLSIPKDGAPGAYYARIPDSGTPLDTYGFGVYPVGLRLQFRNRSRIRPFLSGHTGLLYFFDRVPDDRGRRFNFAAALGGGLEIKLLSSLALTLEYRYHHLSNGFRGSINPGLDVNVLHLGIGTTL